MAEYIEREALINNRPEGRNPLQMGKEEYNRGWNDCRSAFYECIMVEPASDVASVLHGRWKLFRAGDWTSTYECSACRRRVSVSCDNGKAAEQLMKRYPYCNCGAKMDLKEETNA